MAETATEIDRFFFDWRYGDVQRPDQYAGEHWHKARAEVSAFIPAGQRDHPYWASNEPCSMHIDEVEAIWSAFAQRDDWQPFNAKIRSEEHTSELQSLMRISYAVFCLKKKKKKKQQNEYND